MHQLNRTFGLHQADAAAQEAGTALEKAREEKFELQGENNLVVDMLKQQEEKAKGAVSCVATETAPCSAQRCTLAR